MSRYSGKEDKWISSSGTEITNELLMRSHSRQIHWLSWENGTWSGYSRTDDCLKWDREKIGQDTVLPVGQMDCLHWDSEAEHPVFISTQPSFPRRRFIYNSTKIGAIWCTSSDTNILDFKAVDK